MKFRIPKNYCEGTINRGGAGFGDGIVGYGDGGGAGNYLEFLSYSDCGYSEQGSLEYLFLDEWRNIWFFTH